MLQSEKIVNPKIQGRQSHLVHIHRQDICLVNLVEAQKCAWSVQLNAQKVKISDISNVVVKVTNISTNKSYECTLKDGTARLASSFPSSSSVLQFVQPSDATNGRYKDNYKVEITGLTDVATNEEASIHMK